MSDTRPSRSAQDQSRPEQHARAPLRVRLGIAFLIMAAGVLIIEVAIRPFVSPDIVGPSAIKYDPYYGKLLKPGYSGELSSNGYRYRLDVNSLGFRGPEHRSFPKECVLILGDSASFGDTVDNEVVYAERIRRRLNDEFGHETYPVVNTSIAGSGQGYWLRFMRQDINKYEPRYIVMQFCRNDYHDNHDERQFSLDDNEELIDLPIPPQSTFRGIQERVEAIPVLPYSRIYAVFKQAVRYTFTNEGHPEDFPEGVPFKTNSDSGPYDDLTYRMAEDCLEICHHNNWPAIGISVQIPAGERRDKFVDLFQRYGHEFLAIPPISEEPTLYNPVRDEHWNPAGHQYVADVLYERMMAHPVFENRGVQQELDTGHPAQNN